MIVSLKDLASAVQKVKGLASELKVVPGILLDVRDNEILVCYSDGKKSMVEKINAIVGENERLGKIVVAYTSFISALDSCQPSGVLEVPELDITIADPTKNELTLTAKKYVRIGGADDSEGELKEATKFTQNITYTNPDSDVRSAVLGRADYDAILAGDEYDEWSKDALREMLGKVSKEDGKVAYFSRVVGAAYVVNLAYLSFVQTDLIKNHGFSIHTKIAKTVNDMLGKVDSSDIRVTLEHERYCKMRSSDGKFGLWFEIAPVVQMDMTTLKRYEAKSYTTYSLVMLKAAFANAVSCAAACDKNEKTTIRFKQGADCVIAEMKVGEASASHNFEIMTTKAVDSKGDLVGLEIPVSLKVLSDILSNCSNAYVILDIAADETGTFIRISDVAGQDQTGAPIVGGLYYTVASKS